MIGDFTKPITVVSVIAGATHNHMNNGYYNRGVSQDTWRLC